MHFQLETDYYYNEAKKNKEKHSVNSINKKQLKDSRGAACIAHLLATTKDNNLQIIFSSASYVCLSKA